MADLIYDFYHEIDNPSFDIMTSTAKMSIFYMNALPKHSESASSNELLMSDLIDGISIRHRLDPYIVSTEFEMLKIPSEIRLTLTFSTSVTMTNTMINNPSVISAIDAKGNTLLSIIASKMTDDTGMTSPPVTISASGNNTEWILTISSDEKWATSSSRVFPTIFSLDYSLSPLSKVAMSSVRMSAIENETVLYQDTRPDSATMFAAYFFDDSRFERERMISEGKPVCSTIPHVEGDTWDLVQEDFDSYEMGYGGDTRRVWLEIVASKTISSDTPVYYDVIPPGTVSYVGNIAERIGTVGGLPIFRGSFIVTKQSPPSFEDGIGVVRVYINETRTKEIPVRVFVQGSLLNQISGNVSVVGTKSFTNISASVIVVNNRQDIGARVNVISNESFCQIPARVTVFQPIPLYDFIYDGQFTQSTTLANIWEQPLDLYRDYTGTVSQITTMGNCIQFNPLGLVLQTDEITQDWNSEIGITIPSDPPYGDIICEEMAAIRLASAPSPITRTGSIFIGLRYMHKKIDPPTGYEWVENSSTWSTSSPQGIIGIRVEGTTFLGSFSLYRAWTTADPGEITVTGWEYMQRPTSDEEGYDISFTIGPVSGEISVSSVTIMFVPKYCLLRQTDYPYTVESWPGSQMADLYIDNISVRIT